VTNSGDATVTILDPTSGATATIPVGSGPLAATPAGGSVWVVNSVDATVTRASWAAPDDE
jgi:YVTN family beta-propeller protein